METIPYQWRFRTPDLSISLKLAGLPFHRRTIWTWEKKGLFTCPRKNGFRVFTKKMIKEIIKAFGPFGPGYWHWKK